jgi:thiol-disulfide isomerase/thioredoxin
MVFLVAAVVLVAAMALLNLLLTLGMMRRLREQAELLSTRGSGSGADDGVMPAGSTIGEFVTSAVDDTTVTSGDLSKGAAVGFFSPQCQPCRDRVPEFIAFLESVPADGRQAVAVVIGDRADTAEMVAQLRPVARVVTGEAAEPIVKAFDTKGYPALYRMGDDGLIAASGHGMAVFPALAAA